ALAEPARHRVARRAGVGGQLVGRVRVLDHAALHLEEDRAHFFGGEAVVVGEVFEDVARVRSDEQVSAVSLSAVYEYSTMRRSISKKIGRTSSGARPLWSERYLRMLRASAGSSLTLLSVTIRLMVFSQFSGLARRYEMRVMRPLSSERWQPPHFDFTRSFWIGMPSSCGGVAAGAAGGG